MTLRRTSGEHPPRLGLELRERESVKPLELFFDLVFVLGFTQCTALMAAEASWAGIGRGMLVLAVLWWAWVCFTWLTSLIEPEEGLVRLVMLAAATGLLIVALCVPEAFGDRGLSFAIAYGLVRLGQIALYTLARRDGTGIRRWMLGFAINTSIVIGLLVGASFVNGGVQAMLWVAAILIDWCVSPLFGVADWRLVPAHFAERHNLVIILALGESIVALGVGAEIDLTASVILAAVLGMGLASALWWVYFDVVALVTERRLMQAPEGRPATHSLGTRTPTCTSRWWPGSCSLPSGSRRPWRTSTNRSTRCTRSPCSEGRRSISWPTSCCVSATRVRSTSSDWGWPWCCLR